MANCKPYEVVLAGFYPPPFGGESVHVWKLADRLRSEGLLKRVVNLRRGAPPSPDYEDWAGPAGALTCAGVERSSVMGTGLRGLCATAIGVCLHFLPRESSKASWFPSCAAPPLGRTSRRRISTAAMGLTC